MTSNEDIWCKWIKKDQFLNDEPISYFTPDELFDLMDLAREDEAKHYRQAILEAADELKMLGNEGSYIKFKDEVIRKLRISAGIEVKE